MNYQPQRFSAPDGTEMVVLRAADFERLQALAEDGEDVVAALAAEARIAAGEFDSTSEVIRDALRLHEERAVFKSKLLKAIDEGLASPLVEFDMRGWIDSNYPEA